MAGSARSRVCSVRLRSFAWLPLPLVLASCVSITWSIRPRSERPSDLHSFLGAREAAVTGLIAGNEKHIDWAGQPGARTPISIVYIHGLQGSPREYASVIGRIAAAIHANVYYARLK